MSGPQSTSSARTRPSPLEPLLSFNAQVEEATLDRGRKLYRFGGSCHPILIGGIVLGAVIWAAGTFLMSMNQIAPPWLILSVILEALATVAALFYFSRRTRVEVGRGRLSTRTEYAWGFGRDWSVPAQDIRSIRRHVSMRLGGTLLYQLRVRLKDGRTLTAGHGITDKVRAASLASSMEKALR